VRVGVLNDIHGNLPALEAVLDEVRVAGVDRILVGGDVFPGPMAHLVLRRLAAADVPVDFIYGNGEVAILEAVAGRALSRVPAAHQPVIHWNVDQLEPAERQMIAAWPPTRRLDVPPLGEVLFCHATPRNENDIFTGSTPEDRLIPIIEPAHAAVVVCGHTHLQFDRRVGRTRVVNAGSVGMPFGPAGADWLVLGSDIELRHTAYDLEDAARRIRGSGYPGADEFAEKYVLHPPSAAEMLAIYREHELQG
jgi:predicted phosphodiesterase